MAAPDAQRPVPLATCLPLLLPPLLSSLSLLLVLSCHRVTPAVVPVAAAESSYIWRPATDGGLPIWTCSIARNWHWRKVTAAIVPAAVGGPPSGGRAPGWACHRISGVATPCPSPGIGRSMLQVIAIKHATCRSMSIQHYSLHCCLKHRRASRCSSCTQAAKAPCPRRGVGNSFAHSRSGFAKYRDTGGAPSGGASRPSTPPARSQTQHSAAVCHR